MTRFTEMLSSHILKHKITIVVIFILVAIASIFLQFNVNVNYNVADYLPEETPSTEGLSLMKNEFKQPLENMRIMIPNISKNEVEKYQKEIEAIDGIEKVSWYPGDEYYQEKAALLMAVVEEGKELTVVNEIKNAGDGEWAVSGEAVNNANSQRMTSEEIVRIVIFIVPLILIVLILATSSFIEPLLFMVSIGVAIVINMGTNIIFGEVSFITFAVSPILQLAVSLDYAIFLLSRFSHYRQETDNVTQAMILAIKKSVPAIFASALTTIFGFLALAFMKLKIGSDLGINLAKGVLISLLTVMILLPALTLLSNKLIEKTHHKSWMPSWNKLSKLILKIRIPVMIIVFLMIVPAFIFQYKTSFTYGMGEPDVKSEAGRDAKEIDEKFGKSNPVIILIPKDDFQKELQLTAELQEIENVDSAVSLASTALSSDVIPFIDESIQEVFYSENYARILLNTHLDREGEETFSFLEKIEDVTKKQYSQDYYLVGESAVLYDMKEVVTADTLKINLIAVIAIALVLAITFRSLSIPLILLLTIETSIWINLAIPYVTGTTLSYIGFLVVSTVQLGATVDYAILYTDHYNSNREKMEPKHAVLQTAKETIGSIFVSGSILAIAGFTLFFISSEGIVSQLGALFGRGAILSVFMVLLFLPGLLLVKEKFRKK